jgi:hypothetical protein
MSLNRGGVKSDGVAVPGLWDLVAFHVSGGAELQNGWLVEAFWNVVP